MATVTYNPKQPDTVSDGVLARTPRRGIRPLTASAKHLPTDYTTE